MRILHGVSNIAGLPVAFAGAQRLAGLRSTALVYDSPYYPDASSVDFGRLVAGNRLSRKFRRARVVAWALRNFDIFHFHYYTTLMPNQEDLPIIKAAGKKIVFHLHGCDVRDPRHVRAAHAISACAECSIQCMNPIKLRLGRTLARYADATIVSTPDLMEFADGAHYIGNPINWQSWEMPQYLSKSMLAGDRELVVVHAPTNREIKGTRHLESAIAQLRAEGLPIRLQLLEGMSQDRLRQACLDADLVVDQLLVGWFGVFALEMMSAGKAVVAYIRPDLQQLQPDLPIISTTPAMLKETIRGLTVDREALAAHGRKGPAYVREHHDLTTVNKQVVNIYQSVVRH